MNVSCTTPAGVPVEERLRELCQFIKAHEHIADSHTVDFFTSNVWSRLPANWQRQLLALPDSTLCQVPLASQAVLSSTSGDLHQFLESSLNLRLPTESLPHPQNDPADPLQYPPSGPADPLQIPQSGRTDPLRYPQSGPLHPIQSHQIGPATKPLREADALDHFGMTAKKSHEVTRMADMVYHLARSRGAQQVLDLGSGKGYLSQYLAMRYSLCVVGVDAEGTNTHGAEMRNRKTMKALKNVWRAPEKDVTNISTLSGEERTKQTILEEVALQGMEFGTESSSVKKEVRDTEPVVLPSSIQPPTDPLNSVHMAVAVKQEDVHDKGTTSPLECQSSSQSNQAYNSHGLKPSQHKYSEQEYNAPFADDELSDPCHHHHSRDDHTEDVHCVLHGSITGNEHNLVPMESVDSNPRSATPHSHFASHQFHSRSSCYTPVTGFLSLEDEPDTVLQLAEEQSGGAFQRDRPTVIIGLHTCGDLAATCLKFFLKARQLTTLCIVGCCYHHIKEEGEERGFPLSRFLRSLNFQLGRTMRMLAVQSPERLSESEEGLGVESMFYRAVLQVILVKECHIHDNSRDYHIGKIFAKSKGFVDYVRKSLRKLKLELPEGLTDARLQEYWEEYQPYRRTLFAFHQMRATVAPCIEAVIVLDRLLFLRESGLVQHAECLSLFDAKVSPRTFAIVAEK